MEANSLCGGQKFVVEGSGEALSLPEWVDVYRHFGSVLIATAASPGCCPCETTHARAMSGYEPWKSWRIAAKGLKPCVDHLGFDREISVAIYG